MNAGKILLGVLAGAAVGGTIGILFAPKRGKSTRKRILQKRDHYVGVMEDKLDEFIDGVTRKCETAKKKAVHMAEDVKSV